MSKIVELNPALNKSLRRLAAITRAQELPHQTPETESRLAKLARAEAATSKMLRWARRTEKIGRPKERE